MFIIILTVFVISVTVSFLFSYVFLNNKFIKDINDNHKANQMIHIQALYESLNNINMSEQDKIRFAKLYINNFNQINYKDFYKFAKGLK